MDKKVCLKVNGQDIPLNDFVTQVLYKVIMGLVDSLHHVPEEKKKIELTVE